MDLNRAAKLIGEYLGMTVNPRDLREVTGNVVRYICRAEETSYTFSIKGSYVTEMNSFDGRDE